MGTVIVGVALLMVAGIGALAASSRPRAAARLGAGGGAAGCALGLLGAALSFPPGPAGTSPAWRAPWDVPYGEFAIAIDPLSAFFLLIVFGVGLASAIYGAGYLAPHRDRERGDREGGREEADAGARRAALSWCHFDFLIAAMAAVVLARNGVLFLVAWEVMTLASFLLVAHEDDEAPVREAARLYLIAGHTATAFLIALFAGMAAVAGTMDFGTWAAPAGAAAIAPVAGWLFLLALVGFGTKAGLVPFHVWLPEAHPAAPSHVSAVMSGAMLPMGIYGLIRSLTFLGPPPPWWGGILLAVGVASALIGVLFALAQQDIKRLLAYSSVENSGLIAIGLGIGALGLSYDQPAMAALGFGGALLHALNHALFKALLFLGAGAVARSAGTRRLDRLGGLLRAMPVTGACVLVGAAAIAGLPPLNGFPGEFLLLLGSYRGVTVLQGARALLPLAALLGLGLAGGLAAACFTRLFGMAFLGAPRDAGAARAVECGSMMRLPLIGLAAACAGLGLAPSIVLPWLGRAAAAAAGASAGPGAGENLASLPGAAALAGRIPLAGGVLLVLIGALALLRRRLLSRREVRPSITWDCGYEGRPGRAQYTASSFAEPLREMFSMLAPARRRVEPPEGYFPAKASFRSEVVRPFQERLYRPAFEAVSRGMSRLRWLHHGRVQLYVLYIVVTLIGMLAWLLCLPVAR